MTFKLGEINISNKALEENGEEIIFSIISDYKKIAERELTEEYETVDFEENEQSKKLSLKEKPEDIKYNFLKKSAEKEMKRRFKKENPYIYHLPFYKEDKLIVYIETPKGSSKTYVLSGEEYLEREIYNFITNLKYEELDFIQDVFLEVISGETNIKDTRTAKKLLTKFIDINNKKREYEILKEGCCEKDVV